MKLARLLAFWCIPFAIILFGAALAAEKKVSHDDKVQVDVLQFGKMIDITVLPTGNYKWNKKYPARLSFSLCNDTECVMITEEIKVKKD